MPPLWKIILGLMLLPYIFPKLQYKEGHLVGFFSVAGRKTRNNVNVHICIQFVEQIYQT